ncbi:MAG: YigZ family protein [Clostridia bacterium]|nr:YigZ family protein [Clostridia bacterium]
MISSYITVSGTSREEILINKSRFIGYCAPCESETEALAFLQGIRDEHKTATHHCYAYIVGENSGIMRYSDDGEPGGTAGMPIMDVMRAKSVVNCCIVVVRYFGGVLLGTGGLVRAYTQSAQAALGAAGLARIELTSAEECEIPYSVWDRVRYAAEHLPVRIENIRYGSSVSFTLSFRSCDRDTVLPAVLEASGRMMESIPLDECFSPWKTE